MRPFLRPGDILTVTPLTSRRVAIGEILCYEADDRVYVHRVVARQTGALLVRGDALGHVELVRADAVLGHVTSVERRGRLRRLDTEHQRRVGRAIAAVAPVVRRGLHVARAIRAAVRG
jgi:predicted LPLAT superfamily acyltransferase